MSKPFSEYLREEEEKEAEGAIDAYGLTETESPDTAARQVDLARKSGVPRVSVEADQGTYELQEEQRRMREMARQAPALSRWLAESPDNYAIARDDTEKLTAVETAIAYFKGQPKAARAAVPGFQAQYYGARQWEAEQYGNYLRELKDWKQRKDAYEKSQKPLVYRDNEGNTVVNINPVIRGMTGLRAPGDPGQKPEAPLGLKLMGSGTFGTDTEIGFLEKMANLKAPVAEQAAKDAKKALDRQAELAPNTGSFVADSLLSGTTSLVNMLPAIALTAVTKSPSLGSVLMGGQVAGQGYADAREKGLDVQTSEEYAALQGGIELATERIGLGIIFDKILKKEGAGVLSKFVAGFLTEQVQEQAATLGQDFVDWRYLNPDKPIEEYLAEIPTRAAETALATTVAAGGMNATILAIDSVMERRAEEARLAEMSEGELKIDEFLDRVAESALANRSPDSFEELMDRAAAGSEIEEVVLDLDGLIQALYQKGVPTEGLFEELGLDKDKLTEDYQTFGQVSVPLGKIAKSKLLQENRDAVQPNMRTANETYTPAQKKKHRANIEGVLEKEFEENRKLLQDEATRTDEDTQVLDNIREQIVNSRAYEGNEQVIEHNAIMAAAINNTLARRMGVSPKEFYDKHFPGIQFVVGARMGVNPLYQAMRGTRVLGQDGRPMRVYRGQHGQAGGALQSRTNSFVFTNDPEVAGEYATSPNNSAETAEAPHTIPAYVNIRNPIIESSDPFMELSDIADKLGQDEAVAIAKQFSEWIENTSNWQDKYAAEYGSVEEMLNQDPEKVRDLYLDAYPVLDDAAFVEKAKAAGYDGAIHTGNGVGMDSTEYRVFDESQVQYAVTDPTPLFQGARTLSDVAQIVTNPDENANFYITRRGTPDAVGSVSRKYNEHAIGVYVFRPDIVNADYLYYVMQHLHAQGVWKQRATGSTNLVNIRAEDIKKISLDPTGGQQLYQAWEGERVLGFRDEMERGTEPFHDDRLTPYQNKMAEMAINGHSNDEIAEEMETTKGSVAVTLAHLRNAFGINIPKSPNAAQKGMARLRMEELILKGLSNKEVSQRTGKKTNHVAQIRNRLKKEGRLNQATEDGPRGMYDPPTNIITLFEGRNTSTLMHEMSHWYLRQLEIMAQAPDAMPEVRQMLAGVEAWYAKLGRDKDFDLSTEEGQAARWKDRQETWAESFEKYLETGKAPTPGLRESMRAFKQWLLNLWKYLRSRPFELRRANLNPEVVALFDRMLATDEQIDAGAAFEKRLATQVADALLEKGILTKREHEKALKRLPDTIEEVKEERLAALMEDYHKRESAFMQAERERVRAEQVRAIDQSPEGRARAWLGEGQWKGEVAEATRSDEALEQRDYGVMIDLSHVDPSARSIARMRAKLKRMGEPGVIRLVREQNGTVHAFPGWSFTHADYMDLMDINPVTTDRAILELGQESLDNLTWVDHTGMSVGVTPGALYQSAFDPEDAARIQATMDNMEVDKEVDTVRKMLAEAAACMSGAAPMNVGGMVAGNVAGFGIGAGFVAPMIYLNSDAYKQKAKERAVEFFKQEHEARMRRDPTYRAKYEALDKVRAERRAEREAQHKAEREHMRLRRLYSDIDNMPTDSQFDMNSWTEDMTGVSAEFLDDLIGHEAAGDWSARPPMDLKTGQRRSTALGGGQFTEGTWLRLMRKHGADLGMDQGLSRNEILDLRADRRWGTMMTAYYAKENAENFEREMGRYPTQKESYLMHFLGGHAARKMMRMDPDADAPSAFPLAASANPEVFYKYGALDKPRTVKEVMDKQQRRFSAEPLYVWDYPLMVGAEQSDGRVGRDGQ
jgi:hypothetical protein